MNPRMAATSRPPSVVRGPQDRLLEVLMKRELQLGPLLFQFTSFQQWVNKATSWFDNSGAPTKDTICIDAMGRVCYRGKEFMRARDEKTFPITVYHIDPSYMPEIDDDDEMDEGS